MVIGMAIPGPLAKGWHFVESDLHDISKQVKQKDDNARLGVHRTFRTIGLFEKVKLSQKDQDQSGIHVGTVWILVKRFPEIEGEPDARILETMDRIDSHINPEEPGKFVADMIEAQDEIQKTQEKIMIDAYTEAVEEIMREKGVKLPKGRKKMIYVPGRV